MCDILSLYNIVHGGRRRARSPAIIDTASNHGDSLLSRFENEWKRSRKKLQLSICLQSGAPYTTFTWYQHHFSSSCIVVIIFVFLPSYIFIKGFPPRVNYRNFSTSVDTLVHLGTPGMLIGSFRCWSNRLSHKDLQQSNFCQVDHSSF